MTGARFVPRASGTSKSYGKPSDMCFKCFYYGLHTSLKDIERLDKFYKQQNNFVLKLHRFSLSVSRLPNYVLTIGQFEKENV